MQENTRVPCIRLLSSLLRRLPADYFLGLYLILHVQAAALELKPNALER